MTMRPRLRRGFLFAWLALALGVTALLAFQAIYSLRSHREAAESVLRNHAQLAAGEMVDRIVFRFGYYSCAALVRWAPDLAGYPPSDELPTPDDLASGENVSSSAQSALGNVRSIHRYVFRAEPSGAEPSESTASSPRLAATSIPSWVPPELERHARDVFEDDWRWAAVFSDSGAFVYGPGRDGEELAAETFVFVLDREAVAGTLTQLAGYSPLLPAFLLDAEQQESWLHLAVAAPGGGLLVDVGPDADELDYSASRPLEGPLRDLRVSAALRPEAATQLVAGGVPSSNSRAVLILLVLSAGLLLGAYFQVRREAELARLREDFLAGISHELRTPLAQIRMFAETLLLGRVRNEEERERSLEIIGRESKRLSHLVENILLDSRASRGVLKANLEATNLSVLLGEVGTGFEPLAQAKGVRLDHVVEPDLQAHADGDLLRQAVLNLLDNAVKYGPRGQTVTLGAARVSGMIRLWVDDEGPGVPMSHRARVWERFARLDRDRASATAGTGIGLAVVRDLIGMHGGRTWVEDSPGGGARFAMSLPDTEGGGT